MVSFVEQSLISQSLLIPFFPAASTHVSISTTSPLERSKSPLVDTKNYSQFSNICEIFLLYQLLYLSTRMWIRVTTQIRLLRLISRVAPKPSPASPELITWFKAVSCPQKNSTKTNLSKPCKRNKGEILACKRFMRVSMVAVLSGPISYDLITKVCL